MIRSPSLLTTTSPSLLVVALLLLLVLLCLLFWVLLVHGIGLSPARASAPRQVRTAPRERRQTRTTTRHPPASTTLLPPRSDPPSSSWSLLLPSMSLLLPSFLCKTFATFATTSSSLTTMASSMRLAWTIRVTVWVVGGSPASWHSYSPESPTYNIIGGFSGGECLPPQLDGCAKPRLCQLSYSLR